MTNIALWTIGALASGFIGVLLAVIFDEPLRGLFALLLRRRRKPNPLVGMWKTTFEMPSGETYVEVIKIRKRLGRVEGNIVPHADNHVGLRVVEASYPLRLEGELSTSDIFAGKWYHPVETKRYYGTFQLILDVGGERLVGMWLGYSRTQQGIVAGPWTWHRM
ncbi:MAG TPA: hypothetical protein VF548_02665 [Allosphingosinicella sp.]|jgi:hypothetical protein